MLSPVPRLQRVRVSNYRSLGKDQTIELGPLTVLVGSNGSGKSNVVDVLTFVRDAMSMGLSGAITDRGGIQAVRRWSSGRPFNVSIGLEAVLPSGPASYSFEITGDRQEEYRVKSESALVTTPEGEASYQMENGKWDGPPGLEPKVNDTGLVLPAIGGDERFQGLFDLMSRVVIYSIYPDTLRQPQKYSAEKPMQRRGENWVSILRDPASRAWQPDLVAGLGRLTGDICGLKVEKAASYLVARFQHGSNGTRKWFDAGQESDGTLRVAGILTALLQDPPLPLVGIEEPELTVHPGALPLLLDFLEQATKQSQVLVTSHSPELLNLIDPQSIRVVMRGADGTTVRPIDSAQVATVHDGLMQLGELMIAEGLHQQGDLPLSPQ